MKKSIPIKKICKYCNKVFFVIPCHSDAKFCSHDCYSKSLVNKKREPLSKNTKIKIGLANSGKKNGMYGKKTWNKNTKGMVKENSGSFKKEQIPWNKGKGKFKECLYCGKEMWVENSLLKRKKFCSRKCNNLFWKGRRRSNNIGKNNWNWKGGITPLKIIIWKLLKSKAWRLSIFERDKFTCQMPGCNKTTSVLNAHHIIMFSEILKRREQALNCEELWNINNGITLCEKCHKKIRTHENEYINLFNEIIKFKYLKD